MADSMAQLRPAHYAASEIAADSKDAGMHENMSDLQSRKGRGLDTRGTTYVDTDQLENCRTGDPQPTS